METKSRNDITEVTVTTSTVTVTRDEVERVVTAFCACGMAVLDADAIHVQSDSLDDEDNWIGDSVDVEDAFDMLTSASGKRDDHG